MTISDTLNLVQIILAIVLVVVVLMQTKGSSAGGIFGGGGDASSVYRTRRGFERTLFRFTIGLSVTFFLLALINSLYGA